MADLKPVYLIFGDDDAKIDAWRGRLRKRAEEERGAGGLEAFDGADAAPGEVAAALTTLSFDPGTRYLLVENAGAWKAAELDPLEQQLAQGPPDTVLVLLVRGKPLARLRKAVEQADGELRDCTAPKPWELPGWVAERGRELDVELDKEVAKALVTAVGPRQQQLSRELEKLAAAIHPEKRLTAEDVERFASSESTSRAYDLADALVASDLASTLALAEDLRERGEAPGGLVYPVVRRLREVHRATGLLEAGVPEKQAASELGQPPWLAKRTIAAARKADRHALERALCLFADLELDLRGGSDAALDESTAFSLTLARAAA
ncbi:MAG: DNA polymerase III subunit delta [Thermoleophilaceae bacterium]